MTMELTTHKFTAEQYQLMGKVGVFHPEARIELIHGEIAIMSPIGLRHAVTINRLTKFLVSNVGDRGIVSIQNSFRIPEYSEPKPDIIILKPRDDFYAEKFPLPEDILLLIEVADSSLRYDQTTKLALYAEQKIEDYWIVNLERSILENLSPAPKQVLFQNTMG
ncbi:MAG: Uma2 family endonuclease, partial [Oscillatoriales cyanobacterium SM2_1_8]|nr:Uma2 family endonuclease [Oscillatoriales cyanobacterium SM2_1_8]